MTELSYYDPKTHIRAMTDLSNLILEEIEKVEPEQKIEYIKIAKDIISWLHSQPTTDYIKY